MTATATTTNDVDMAIVTMLRKAIPGIKIIVSDEGFKIIPHPAWRGQYIVANIDDTDLDFVYWVEGINGFCDMDLSEITFDLTDPASLDAIIAEVKFFVHGHFQKKYGAK